MNLARILRRVAVLGAFAVTALAYGTNAEARPQYAQKEAKACGYCHASNGGGARNYRGMFYGAHKLSFADFDNEYEAKAAGVDPKAMAGEAVPKNPDYPGKLKVPEALKFVLKDIDGKPVNLARYEGKVLMLVNVASKCGYTPQYEDLQKVYAKYKKDGLVIVGVPSNDFGMQEPGTEKDIKEFCSSKYKVTFPLMSKVDVKGDDQIPLYKYLTDKEKFEKTGGEIKWNFTKFLYSPKGEVIARYEPAVKPTDPKVIADIEKALKDVKDQDKPKEEKKDAQ